MKNTETYVDAKAVAERAYQLYLARGGEDGHDLEDWVCAEQELRRGKTTQSTQSTPLRPTARPSGRR